MTIAVFSGGDITTNTGAARSSASFNNSLNKNALSRNYLLLVATAWRTNAVRTSTAVTYNGASLAEVPGGSYNDEYASGFYHGQKWWYAVDPSTAGSSVVNVTYSGNMQSDAIAVFTLEGVDPNTPFGATPTLATGSGATPSVALTTIRHQSWVVGRAIMRRASGGSYTPGGVAIELTDGESDLSANSGITFTDLYLPTTTPGSYTLQSTNSVSAVQHSILAIEVIAAGGWLPTRHVKTYLRM